MSDDIERTSDALERLEAGEYAHARSRYVPGGLQHGIGFKEGYPSPPTSARIRAKGEEDRAALQAVLSALNADISLPALERAVATVKSHLSSAL